MPRLRTFGATALAITAALALAACGAQDGSNPAGSAIPTASGSAVVGNTEGATAADVQAADLEPCPTSDPNVAPRADGLPDLTLACLGKGDPVRLAGLRGKPMVVNVWASWCGPCKEELPMMGEFYRANSASLSFLGIDMADDRVAALAMAGRTKMTFASVQDPNSQVRAGLRVVGVPTTLFVRADGTVAGRAGVVSSRAELAELVEKYLGVTVS